MEDTLRTTSATSTSTTFATAANTTTLLKSNIETESGQQEAPRRDQQFFLKIPSQTSGLQIVL